MTAHHDDLDIPRGIWFAMTLGALFFLALLGVILAVTR
jgi:hypothetical protein